MSGIFRLGPPVMPGCLPASNAGELPGLQSLRFQDILAATLAHSPYLRGLVARFPGLLPAGDSAGEGGVWRAAQEAVTQEAIAAEISAASRDLAEVPVTEYHMAGLRRAKARAHLLLALADLTGEGGTLEITRTLSDFADHAVQAALAAAARKLFARDAIAGFFVLALGKHGARILNYSSDIDICFYYERASCPLSGADAVRLAQAIIDLLMRQTEDGYVARVDTRLRPDPSAHAIAVATEAAENYFESYGQNWERAAYIKARPVAGDPEAAARFLAVLGPFVWRRYLDHAAIADIHSIKRQINAKIGSKSGGGFPGGLELAPGFDVKLGRGGIREIEFFTEVQQLILGGRDESLRVRDTCSALAALARRQAISEATAAELTEIYVLLRGLEHRAQMLRDEQTHAIPDDPALRADFARFCGHSELAGFDDGLRKLRGRVQTHYGALFPEAEDLSDPLGSLVFTGVGDDPETIRTLTLMGFREAAFVAGQIRDWHRGRIRASRSARAREALTFFVPKLLRALSETGDPDIAFRRFEDFFGRLPAGVQVMAMLNANPHLLRGLCRVLGLAPALARALGAQPSMLDAMVDAGFVTPLGTEDSPARLIRLRSALRLPRTLPQGFEAGMNHARRAAKEERFRIAFQLLSGHCTAQEASAAWSDLAEASLQIMADLAVAELARREGPPPGTWAIAALGKLGGQELAEGGDLDLMLLYDAEPAAASQAGQYFTKLAHRLVTALSAPTEEGVLYPIDMQLRPSGRAGPVAVRRAAFKRYYQEEAWTWELMALTRLRMVAGDSELCGAISDSRLAALCRARKVAEILADVRNMREKLASERPPENFWDLKFSPGGIVDVEFIAQGLMLIHGEEYPEILVPNIGLALAAMAERNILIDSRPLRAAHDLFGAVQQILRVATGSGFNPSEASQGLEALLTGIAGVDDFPSLTNRISAARDDVLSARHANLGW